jgi:hypothetical protein
MIGIGVKPSIIGLDSETRVFEAESDDDSMGETMSLTVKLEWLLCFLGFSQTLCNLAMGSPIELQIDPSLPMGGEAELLVEMDVLIKLGP